MSYQYDYFVSYAQKDNEDGFVGQLVEQLVSKLGSEKDSGAKPRVFFDNGAVRDAENWTSEVKACSTSGALVVFSRRITSIASGARWSCALGRERRRSLPDSEIVIIQLDGVRPLRRRAVDVHKDCRLAFNWVSSAQESRF